MRLLIQRIDALRNPTVVGLDPTLDTVPGHVKEEAFAQYGKTAEGAAAAFLTFNKAIIDAVYDVVPAVKPQCAYYEALGWQGMRCLWETIVYARKKGMYVIIDGKRNDIGSTMSAYAAAHLGETLVEDTSIKAFYGHGLTVNGYLGSDGIVPLLSLLREDRDQCIFVLVKTSNPSSGELQDRLIDGKPLYELMGQMVEQWGKQSGHWENYSQVGAVVGATYPEQLRDLREKLPHTFFLVPGYGAQGGTAKDVEGAFDAAGRGAIVNSSRGIIAAWKTQKDPLAYAQWAREAALDMRGALRKVIGG